MADDKEKVTYRIIIDTADNSATTKPSKPKDKQPTQPKYVEPKSAIQQLIDFKNEIQGIAGYSVAMGLAKQSFGFVTQVVLRSEGNSAVSERVNTAFDIAGKVGAIGGGMALSVATGNVTGMIASFGAAVSTLMSKVQEIEQRAYQSTWDNADLMLKRERGGTALNRSRL